LCAGVGQSDSLAVVEHFRDLAYVVGADASTAAVSPVGRGRFLLDLHWSCFSALHNIQRTIGQVIGQNGAFGWITTAAVAVLAMGAHSVIRQAERSRQLPVLYESLRFRFVDGSGGVG